ncbi:hypothetical protein, partial [Burkholderia thailandensis]|uniref:hypothetical protein n=1 Tax=Burkholderia thailandensis TaxID=57975 RepID=UPI001E31D41C
MLPIKSFLRCFVFFFRWNRKRFAEAHKAAGPRYTPELNIELSLADHFHALGRTPEFFDRIRSA